MEKNTLKIVYIGSAIELISSLKYSDLFEVTAMETPIEATQYLRSHPETEAVICEASLPFTDGIQVRDLLLKEKLMLDKPFILIDLNNDNEMRNAAFEAGVHDCFSTPIDPERIYNRINYLQRIPESMTTNEHNSTHFTDTAEIYLYKTPLLKRLFDITIAGFALIVLSPLILLLAIIIKLDSKGPSIDVSTRVGSNFKAFGLLLFRTMRSDADEMLSKEDLSKLNMYSTETIDKCPKCAELPNGQHCSALTYGDNDEIICEHLRHLRESAPVQQLKLEPDPRVTKVGSFLRKNGLDKLPVLFNIIKGDMSIVGNEPLPEYEAEMLSADSKLKGGDRHKRFLAAAGLTGLWQVELRGKGGELSVEERISLEAKYAENNSFWGDIKLIFRTVKVIIQRGDV